MKQIFTRSPNNPILKPNPENQWESHKVYNCGALFDNGEYHLFYRAMSKNWVSKIGYAKSLDGESYTRFKNPALYSQNNSYSMEDPRIVKVDNQYFLTYTKYDGLFVTLNLTTTKNLKEWEDRGPMIPDWNLKKAGGFLVPWDPAQVKAESNSEAAKKWCKAGAIFPETIGGKYWMLFGDRNIWLASSHDGIVWEPVWNPFIKARSKNYFDEKHVEMGPPPIKTNKGWLVLYHGVTSKIEYKIGLLLLDINDPTKILYRSNEPIFEPQETYELSGIVDILPGGYEAMQKMSKDELEVFINDAESKGTMPKVVFCCGAVLANDILRIYYGASDSVICTATAKLADILALVP
ncbi:MAG: hypothetical protein HYT12_00615 [Candidatus Liptonbacteria bacterium]|nr:hypothetical protein [Candidatus Liptonbacteria bacterium]